MIAGPVVEPQHVDLTVALNLIRFSPEHPEGVRITQETARYRLSDRWFRQAVKLYTRSVPGVSHPMDEWSVEFSDDLRQSAPGWVSTGVVLRVNGFAYHRRPVQFYVREACGIPSGTALWVDLFDQSVTYLMTIETLEVPK